MAAIAAPQAPFRFEQFHGTGLAVVRCHEYGAGRRAHEATGATAPRTRDAIVEFEHLAFTFPLKLISPRCASRDAIARIARADTSNAQTVHKPVAALYVVGYGGGLVSGDSVVLDVDVGQGCTMLLLTQGSTKVYKMRDGGKAGLPASSSSATSHPVTTSQTLRCIVRASAALVVLPDPVTCFASARYNQTQRFDLRSASSSLVVLDWLTPGRVFLTGRGGKPATSERWAFSSYQSRNEVRIDGRVVVRDVLLLDEGGVDDDKTTPSHNTIAQRCDPYTCFATMILCGPDVQPAALAIRQAFHAIQQHSRSKAGMGTQDLLWSCSPFAAAEGKDDGLVVRVAGLSTEMVRGWLRENLRPLTSLVGDDLYRQALG